MTSSYSYSFNYPNGRMAVKGYFSGDKKEIFDMAAKLSIEKKRVIVVHRHTLRWYTDMNAKIAGFEKGKRVWGEW